jgi:Outer membrane lipoprotein-sorting protein
VLALFLALAFPARAETADDIIARARTANRVESAVETIQMTIVSKTGAERKRELQVRSRREGDIAKTYIRINSPSDVAGMQLVMVDHPVGKTDEQLVYMPALKRVNAISADSRKGSFAGSDFTYEDLEIREAATGSHVISSETPEAWVIDTTPAAGSSYTKLRSTIHKADMVIHRVEFYDASGLVKVLEVKRTEKEGAVTIPVESELGNVRAGTKTRLVIVSHRFGVPKAELPDETFTREYLQRGS